MNGTLGQMLKAEFGGEIEVEWGVPMDDNLRADLTRVRKKPSKEQIEAILVSYFSNYGFKRIGANSPPAFEDAQHKNHRASCYTYSKYLEKLIVSAAKF